MDIYNIENIEVLKNKLKEFTIKCTKGFTKNNIEFKESNYYVINQEYMDVYNDEYDNKDNFIKLSHNEIKECFEYK